MVIKDTSAQEEFFMWKGWKGTAISFCKTKLDRDINGARNILLRYLTKKEKESA